MMRRPRPIALFTARLHSRTETRALAEDPAWSPIAVRVLVSALVFLALAGLLAGCSLLASQKIDPYAEIRQSWHEDFAMTDAELDALPFYSVTVRVDPAERTYTGTLNLRWPFTGTAPLSSLFFRTYPNLITFGGNLQVTGAGVNTINVPFRPAVDNTAVELVLPEPLQPGTTADIWLAFDGKLPDEGKVGEYTIFGTNEGVLSLTNFYPILASRRGDEWALDIPHPRGDVGFQEAGLYRAQVTLPPGEVTIATGMEITHTHRRGRLGDDRIRARPRTRVQPDFQPALSGARDRGPGHQGQVVLLPGRRGGRGIGALRRGGRAPRLQRLVRPLPLSRDVGRRSPADVSRHGVPVGQPHRQPGLQPVLQGSGNARRPRGRAPVVVQPGGERPGAIAVAGRGAGRVLDV